jgi:starch synthase
MHVVFAASECVPFCKTGGLADVIGALAPELASSQKLKTTVYLPRYRDTPLGRTETVIPSLTVPFDDEYRFCSVLNGGTHAGVQFYFIDYPPYFDREGLYGTPMGDYRDNAERFALYARAVVEASKILGPPDIFHCHDWQAALIPVLLRTLYRKDPAFLGTGTVFTIHNIGYQGLFPPDTLPLLMLPWDLFTINKMEFYGKVNFMKGAIVFSDFITTVSKKYSQEIQTPEYGFGLEGVLRDRASTVTGILNGVDYREWNPETDRWIAAHYSAQDLRGKAACRRDLLSEFGLNPDEANVPVIGIVSRFAAQKGFDLLSHVADLLAREPMVMLALGSGEKVYEDLFRRLSRQYPRRFSVRIAYDEPLAHKIQAGADMFLMPSHYEPCGLSQIYALKYGTVPIVRATGGLDDTIEQWDPETKKGTGFKFSEYKEDALLSAIHAAFRAFQDRTSWEILMRNGMAKDFSWKASAKEYLRVYDRVRQLRAVPA